MNCKLNEQYHFKIAALEALRPFGAGLSILCYKVVVTVSLEIELSWSVLSCGTVDDDGDDVDVGDVDDDDSDDVAFGCDDDSNEEDVVAAAENVAST